MEFYISPQSGQFYMINVLENQWLSVTWLEIVQSYHNIYRYLITKKGMKYRLICLWNRRVDRRGRSAGSLPTTWRCWEAAPETRPWSPRPRCPRTSPHQHQMAWVVCPYTHRAVLTTLTVTSLQINNNFDYYVRNSAWWSVKL